MATKTRKKKTKVNKKDKNIKRLLAIIFAVLCLAIGVAVFQTMHKNQVKNHTVDFGKDRAVGVDLSYHNGNVDFSKLKDNVDFAIIRIGYTGYTEGESNMDKKAKSYIKSAKKAGIPIGVYYYSQATTVEEAEKEAKFVLGFLDNYYIDLPVFYDVEYAEKNGSLTGRLYNAKLSKNDQTDIINAFCNKLEKADYMTGVYSSTYMFESRINIKKLNKNAYIWLADYNDKVTYNGHYDIWQYTNKGKIDGVKNKVDKNYWYSGD